MLGHCWMLLHGLCGAWAALVLQPVFPCCKPCVCIHTSLLCVRCAVEGYEAHLALWGKIGDTWRSVASSIVHTVPGASHVNCRAEWARLVGVHKRLQAAQRAASGTNEEYTEFEERMESLVNAAADMEAALTSKVRGAVLRSLRTAVRQLPVPYLPL